MDYINANFSTLEDFGKIDSKINELVNNREYIKLVANSKISRSVDADELDTDEAKSKRVEEFYDEIQEVLSSLNEHDTDAVKNAFSSLREKYGSLKVLNSLEANVEDVVYQEKVAKLLERAFQIQKKVEGLDHDDIQALSSIIDEIGQIEEVSTAEAVQEACSELREIVKDRVYEAKRKAETKLSKALEAENWLSPDFNKSEKLTSPESAIMKTARRLVDIQALVAIPEYPESFWATDVILRPIFVRFNYHFNSQKDTNKLSKPEWLFDYMENMLSEYLPVIKLVFGEIFSGYSRFFEYEIITSLLKVVRLKLYNIVDIINREISKLEEDEPEKEKWGRVLSHLFYETIFFDQRLRNNFKYNPYARIEKSYPTDRWLGLIGDVLLRTDKETKAVDNWLSFEYRLATQSFNNEIINIKNAFQIDYEYQGSEESNKGTSNLIKPSYSAYNLIKLFDGLTNHHRYLNIVKYQLKFVSRIQLNILEIYLEKINQLHKQFDASLSQRIVNTFMPGGLTGEKKSKIDNKSRKELLESLEMLAGLHCSANFVLSNLEEWSDDLIFVQLWESLKKMNRSSFRTEQTIFDSFITRYGDTLKKIRGSIHQYFRDQIKAALKQYVNSTRWDISYSPSEISAEIIPLVQILPTSLDLLKKSLPKVEYFIITDQIVTNFCFIFFDYIITNNQFSINGVNQLNMDFNYISDQLKHNLFLVSDVSGYSNLQNKSYLKVKQSIDLLNNRTSKSPEGEHIPSLRHSADHHFDLLSDHEIRGLVRRVLD
ncbi:Piso0_000130 [Millerozyma farinosa CBS 7064]|uniref:Piso0_000130 protein n=1 Tax=Pichia sorbitophila (strain ATCC MYA-4447 / BCRC 22081 / CBS 7064 / NBRC 10061 / NRRL Y-12695) TaxID=559304 RepID=G8YUL5_PICSO|nr:Piso0_000130 [Millerozyma farinosa CBS 7064]